MVLLSLVFFTLFGDGLYEWGKPEVETARASSFEGQKPVFVPTDSLHSDNGETYVYVLLSERGYCRMIYTISKVVVEVDSINIDRAMLSVQSDIKSGDIVIVNANGDLSDGIRVIAG